jgi:hypothetical protein
LQQNFSRSMAWKYFKNCWKIAKNHKKNEKNTLLTRAISKWRVLHKLITKIFSTSVVKVAINGCKDVKKRNKVNLYTGI